MFETELSENAIKNLKVAVQIYELLEFSEDLNFHFVNDKINIQSYDSKHNFIISMRINDKPLFDDKKLVVSDSSGETIVTVKRSNLKRAMDYMTEFYSCTLKYEKDTIKFIVNLSLTYKVVSIKAISSYKLKVPTIYGCELFNLKDIFLSFGLSSKLNISFNENGIIFSDPDSDEVDVKYICFSNNNNKDESTIFNETTISRQIPVSFVKDLVRIAEVLNYFTVFVGFQDSGESEFLLIEYKVINNYYECILDSIKENFSPKKK